MGNFWSDDDFQDQVNGFVDAAREGDLDKLEEYFQASTACLNAVDAYDRTALMVSIENSHKHITKYLLDISGLRIDRKTSTNHTALMCACVIGDVEIVNLLIAMEADINLVENEVGWTPLFFAVGHGHIDIVNILCEENPKNLNHVDDYGQTILHLASSEGLTQLVSLFLQKGLDPTQPDADGSTPIDVADNQEILDLISHFSDISKNDPPDPTSSC